MRVLPRPSVLLAVAVLLVVGGVTTALLVAGWGDGTGAPSGDGDEAGRVDLEALRHRRAAAALGGIGVLFDLEPLAPDLEACLGDEALPGPPAAGHGDGVSGVADRVAELRGLSSDERPEVVFLPPDDMAEEVARRFDVDAEDVEAEQRALVALGALPADADLRAFRVEVFAEQVSGLYTGETVSIRSDDETLTPLEEVVLAHELEHDLSDEAFGRPTRGRDVDADARRAALALVEGSATLTMAQYMLTVLPPAGRDELREELIARAEEGVLAGQPPYLVAELRYPYQDGLRFACALYADGGWAAVDDAYVEPPTTSAEILFPHRYRTGRAATEPPALGHPGAGWQQLHTATFGAAELASLLALHAGEAPTGSEGPRARVAGWDGGVIEAWANGSATAVGVAFAQADGEPSLCGSLREHLRATLTDAEEQVRADGAVLVAEHRAGVVSCPAGGVRLAVAPTLREARRIAGP